MGRTILSSQKVNTKSIGANSVFKRADEIHSLVGPHLKYVLDLEEVVNVSVSEVKEYLKPIPTADSEAQTLPVEFKEKVKQLRGKVEKEPPMLSTRASQTSTEVHSLSMQTSREFLADGICQTNSLPTQENATSQTMITTLTKGTQVDNELKARVKTSGAISHPRRKRAVLSCLKSQDVTYSDAYMPLTEITREQLLDGETQTQTVDMSEAFAQTIKADAVQTSEALIQTTAKDYVNMESQTSSEPPVACVVSEASMTSATEVSDMVSQAPAPTEVNEASIQTADKHVTDEVSQTPAPPDLSEASVQTAAKQVTDMVSQTPEPPVVCEASIQTIHVAKQLSDMVSQTPASPELIEASIQTADKHVTDKVSQTPALPNLSEASVQTTANHVTDTVSQTPMPPAMLEVSIQTSIKHVAHMISQTPEPPVVREASIQTADKHVTDKISQTLAPPNLSEVSIQTTTKQCNDVVSQTEEPLYVNGASHQTPTENVKNISQVPTPQDKDLNGVTETQEEPNITNGGSTKSKKNKQRVMDMVEQMESSTSQKRPSSSIPRRAGTSKEAHNNSRKDKTKKPPTAKTHQNGSKAEGLKPGWRN